MKGRTDSFTHLSRVRCRSPRSNLEKGMGPWLLTSLELLNSSALDKREDNAGRVMISLARQMLPALSGAPSCLPSCPGGVMVLAASQDQLCYFVPRQFFYGLFLPMLGRRMCLSHQITSEMQQLALGIFWDVTPVCSCTHTMYTQHTLSFHSFTFG